VTPRAPAPGRRRVDPVAQPGLPFSLPTPTSAARPALEASTPCAAPFDGDDWVFGVEWEGSRCQLTIAPDGAVRVAGEMADLDDRFPEIVAGAAIRGGRSALLDGTACVLDAQGCPDLEALFRRVAQRTSGPHTVFLTTDLLHLDGEPITDRPLHARLTALAELVVPDSRIQVPDHVAGHGRALAEVAAARGLAAIVARHRDAPYRAGVASPDRLRISLAGRRDAVVVGWQGRETPERVLIADWVGGRLGLVGTAAVESSWARQWLAASLETAREVLVDEGRHATIGVTWARPRLVATVEPHAPRGPGGHLPTWHLVTVRDDVDPRWCVRRPPVVPPQARVPGPLRPFSPTVLSPLPLDGAA
jgi:bifunctional non-homologous end joining protein LigD